MNESKKEEKKGGFWGSLFGRSGAGSSSSGGAGLSSAGSGGGLFASKAGFLGVVLGSATIAAGIGVIYNFIGPSPKSVSPQLFQDAYYEELARNASLERAKQKEGAESPASTIDMFGDQARKDGFSLGDQEEAADENKDAAVADAEAGAQAAGAGSVAPSADPSSNAPKSGAKLQASSGFAGGGSSAKMAAGGGMSGGANNQSAPVYKSSGGQGKSSSMSGSMASGVKSTKRALSNFNRKGALGQAKFARAQGMRAAGSSSAVASRTGATEAFSGETSGSGQLGTGGGGVGLGGSGISDGAKLKNSDPSLNSNESTPPKVGPAKDVSPWDKYTNMALYAMIAGVVLIFASTMCSTHAKALAATAVGLPAAAGWYTAAIYTAYAAMAAGAVAIFAGMMLMSKYGQKWMGLMYIAAGAMIIWKAWEALTVAQAGVAAATPAAGATGGAAGGAAGGATGGAAGATGGASGGAGGIVRI
ncbi:MAG: hypothetical protein WCK75_11760 [Elusimicrobiota bacterium]